MSPRLQAWQQGGQWTDWHGERVFYRIAGSGPALLLVHGYPVGSYDWHAIWNDLAAHFTLIAPDMLGLGFSSKPMQGNYSLAEHARMHDALLKQLGISRCHVMGHDLGVSVVQEMLAQRRETTGLPKFASIILLNGGVCPEAYQPRLIQRLLVTRLGAWLGPRVSKERFVKTIAGIYQGQDAAPTADVLDDFWQLLRYGEGQAITHRVGACWQERKAIGNRLVGALLQSRVPLRFINGAADRNSGAHMMRAFLRHAPAADVVSLPTMGHWPQIQAPKEVVQASLAFYRKHS
ncbi:MAG: alpha/beta fold hydrolase [Brachymonas sp.]